MGGGSGERWELEVVDGDGGETKVPSVALLRTCLDFGKSLSSSVVDYLSRV